MSKTTESVVWPSVNVYTYMGYSSDCPGAVAVLQTTKGEKFMFGHVTEGTQRAILEQRPKITKMSGIYLTGPVSWSTLSGLAGFLLTLVGMGKSDLALRSCGENVGWFCATWRHFVFHKTMSIHTERMIEGHVDEFVNIGGVLITPTTAKNADSHSQQLSKKNLQPLRRDTPWGNVNNVLQTMFSKDADNILRKDKQRKQTSTVLPEVDLDERSTCYIVQMHEKRGKFDGKLAAKLNVPRVKIKDLIAGQDLTLEDGTTVTRDMFIKGNQQYGRILFLDIPDSRYVDGVINCPEWTRNYDSKVAQPVYGGARKRDSAEIEGNVSETPETLPEAYISQVYHFFGPEMESYFAGNPEPYFEWMDSLGDVVHVVSAPWLDPHALVYRGSASLCVKLRNIMGDQFPLHVKDYRTLKNEKSDFLNNQNIQQRFNIHPMTARDAFSIEPNLEPTKKVVVETTQYDGLDYATEVTEVDRPYSGSLKGKAELLTLGTGSACPSKYRNVAGLIMRVPTNDSFTGVVMDCGEGTYGTLTRMYSASGVQQIMKEIKILYISHLHADHHLGAPNMIFKWMEANPVDAVLTVVGPPAYKTFLEEMANFQPEIRARINFYGCWSYLEKHIASSQLPEVPGLTSIKTCRAQHCDDAFCAEFGFELDDKETFKFAYSGDTRPIKRFAELAKNCDLVIHEATLDNDLAEEALIKRHCTFKEALDVCEEMQADHVVLTHFSQRYPKLPELSSLTLKNKTGKSVPVAISFDMMRIRLGEIDGQAKHFDAISAALANEEEIDKMDEDKEL